MVDDDYGAEHGSDDDSENDEDNSSTVVLNPMKCPLTLTQFEFFKCNISPLTLEFKVVTEMLDPIRNAYACFNYALSNA